MSQETSAHLGALLRLLEEEEVWKLPHDGTLRAEHILHDLDTLVSAHQVKEDLQGLLQKWNTDYELYRVWVVRWKSWARGRKIWIRQERVVKRGGRKGEERERGRE